MAPSSGFSVRIFIPSGDPEGIRVVEKSNWTGRGLVFPKSLFGEAKKRDELSRTGVYVLWGPSDSTQFMRVYIGQADSIAQRLAQHVSQKDFWTNAVVFISKDENLNTAHCLYLESQLISLAEQAKRCELENSQKPKGPSLSEADIADADLFLQDVLLCLPVVGVPFFDRPKSKPQSRTTFVLESGGIRATGYESTEGFVVLSGSKAKVGEVKSIHTYLTELRAILVQNGVFAVDGETYTLTQDYVFSSPSTAAGVLLGRSANGRAEWKTKDGRTLKSVQEQEAQSAVQ